MPHNHLALRHVRLLPEAVLAVLVLGGDGARVEGAVPGEGSSVPPRYVDSIYLDVNTRYVDIYLSTHQLLILTISRNFALTTSTCSWLHTDPGAPWLGYRIIEYETMKPISPTRNIFSGCWRSHQDGDTKTASKEHSALLSRAASEAAALVPCYMWTSHICDTGPSTMELIMWDGR